MEAFFVLMFAAMGAGQNSALATDTGKARAARSRVFRILDRVRGEDLKSENHIILDPPVYTVIAVAYTYEHPL
jgi:hypothetical protein